MAALSEVSSNYYGRLADETSILEALGHSAAFQAAMLDQMTERESSAHCATTTIPRYRLPETMVALHGFPLQFEVNNFAGNLLQLPADETGSSWLFTATYDVNGRDFSLFTNGTTARLSTTSAEDNELSYNLAAGSVTTWLRALTVATRERYGVSTRQDLPTLASDDPVVINKLLSELGNLDGFYQSRTRATFPMLEAGRAAILSLTEIETPTTSEIRVDCDAVWQAGEEIKLTTRVASHQHELSDNIDPDQSSHVRYAEQGPTSIAPGDWLAGSLDEIAVNSLLFEPDQRNPLHTRAYGQVNVTLMTILRPYLLPHAHLDAEPEAAASAYSALD